jgi:TonB family protein
VAITVEKSPKVTDRLAAKSPEPKPEPAASDPKPSAQLQVPGGAIQQATRDAAARRASTTRGDEFGLGVGAHGRQMGGVEILSDTEGVDFGPYVARVLQDVKENWWRLIPKSDVGKKVELAIEFAITKDGKVAGTKLTASSGDVSLDRAAWGSITASNPFPPLPSEFGGQYLALRFGFFYNPDHSTTSAPN